MKESKDPEIVTATQEEIDPLLTLARASFPTKQYQLLEGVLGTFVYMMLKLQTAKTSIKRLQRMLFGGRTEHKRNVLERAAGADDLHRQDARGVGGDLAAVVVAWRQAAPSRSWPQRGAGLPRCAHRRMRSPRPAAGRPMP